MVRKTNISNLFYFLSKSSKSQDDFVINYTYNQTFDFFSFNNFILKDSLTCYSSRYYLTAIIYLAYLSTMRKISLYIPIF